MNFERFVKDFESYVNDERSFNFHEPYISAITEQYNYFNFLLTYLKC